MKQYELAKWLKSIVMITAALGLLLCFFNCQYWAVSREIFWNMG